MPSSRGNMPKTKPPSLPHLDHHDFNFPQSITQKAQLGAISSNYHSLLHFDVLNIPAWLPCRLPLTTPSSDVTPLAEKGQRVPERATPPCCFGGLCPTWGPRSETADGNNGIITRTWIRIGIVLKEAGRSIGRMEWRLPMPHITTAQWELDTELDCVSNSIPR